MPAVKPSVPSKLPTAEPRFFKIVRPVMWVCVICIVTGGGIWGYLWWDERDLREANQTLSKGNAEEALKIVQKYLKTHPPHEGALAMKGRALVALGRYSEALELFSSVGPADLADLRACATACLHLEQWAQAVGLLESALKLSPHDPDLLHELTAARAFVGNRKDALVSAVELSQIPGHEARGFVQIGTIERDLQHRQKAIAAWEQVLKLDPDVKQIQLPGEIFFHDLGVLYLDDGNAEAALKYLDRSVQFKPTALGLVHRGQAKSMLGKKADAIIDWKHALDLDPGHREAREDLASAALEAKQADDAQEWLKPLLSGQPLKSSSTYLMQRAAALRGDQTEVDKWRKETDALRKRERVEVAVNQILLESPQSFWAQVLRAYRFAEGGNWQQAQIQIEPVMKDVAKEPFLRDLAVAIQNQGPLPKLENLPLKK